MIKHALIVAILCIACSDNSKRAATAPACTGVGCASGTGGGTSNGSDATVEDSSTDSAFDVGDAGVAVTAIVRSVARFTDDPATGTPVTTMVLVRANKVGGGVVDGTLASDGTHTLNGVAVTAGVPTNFAILQGGIIRANDGIWLPATATINLPLFPESLPGATWPTLVATPPTVPSNSAHVVIHVVNSAGARVSGATATSPSADAKGAFYDDGSDISVSAKSTGARGTILFMGTLAAEIAVTITAGAKNTMLRIPLTANAVSYVTAPLI